MRMVVLALALMAVPGDLRAQTSSGPLAPTVLRASVSSMPASRPRGNWAAVRALSPGVPIVVFVDSMRVPGLLGGADALALIVMDLRGLPPSVAGALREVVEDHAEYLPLAWTPGGFDHKDVFVRKGGIFAGSTRVASTTDVVRRISRDSISELRVGPIESGSLVATIAGVAGGTVLGFLAAGYLSETEGGAWKSTAVMIGAPVALGTLGNRAVRHRSEKVIYTR